MKSFKSYLKMRLEDQVIAQLYVQNDLLECMRSWIKFLVLMYLKINMAKIMNA